MYTLKLYYVILLFHPINFFFFFGVTILKSENENQILPN